MIISQHTTLHYVAHPTAFHAFYSNEMLPPWRVFTVQMSMSKSSPIHFLLAIVTIKCNNVTHSCIN